MLDEKTSQSKLVQLVIFLLDKEEYGVDVLDVREIIRVPIITQMPNSADFIEGIINLRGKVIPIISLRKKFKLEELIDDSDKRIIVLEKNEQLLGFIVDAVDEVIDINSEDIGPPPVAINNDQQNEIFAGIIQKGEKLIVLLDLVKSFDFK
jgi:purine-binding chemotaxis protein CheW